MNFMPLLLGVYLHHGCIYYSNYSNSNYSLFIVLHNLLNVEALHPIMSNTLRIWLM